MRPPIHVSDPDRRARHYWVMKLASQNINWLNLLKLIMTAADVGITDVSVKKEEALPESFQEFLIYLKKTQTEVSGNQPQGMSVAEYLQQYIEFHHEGDSDGFVLKEEDESRGTQV